MDGENEQEIFLIDILQGEKYIIAGEQNKTPWWQGFVCPEY